MKVTAADIVSAIGNLPKDKTYHYVDPKNKGVIEITHIAYPEGPITIKRYNPSKGGTPSNGKTETISPQMIWRVANAFVPGQPINIDRVLGASYNTRSVLEALLAHTPQFYFSYPGRIENVLSSTKIQKGHKHLLWLPEKPHAEGIISQAKTEIVISEIPNFEIIYDALAFPDQERQLDIEINRRHAQIQIALVEIGRQLNFRTWVALNDKGITYKDKKLGEMPGIVNALEHEKLLQAFDEARKAALMIDCIWFRNSKFIPAVMEIEHSTGVTSGLTRMKNLQDNMPPYPTRYVIVAPDEDREKVLKEANKEQFKTLKVKYFPYSAVEDLYALCMRRNISAAAINEEFLDCFMEPGLKPDSFIAH